MITRVLFAAILAGIAAGIVMLREAGAYATDIAGKDKMLETGSIVAGNETIHAKLLKLLKAADARGPAPVKAAGKTASKAPAKTAAK